MPVEILTPDRCRIEAPAATIDVQRIEGQKAVTFVVTQPFQAPISMLLEYRDAAMLAEWLVGLVDEGGG